MEQVQEKAQANNIDIESELASLLEKLNTTSELAKSEQVQEHNRAYITFAYSLYSIERKAKISYKLACYSETSEKLHEYKSEKLNANIIKELEKALSDKQDIELKDATSKLAYNKLKLEKLQESYKSEKSESKKSELAKELASELKATKELMQESEKHKQELQEKLNESEK